MPTVDVPTSATHPWRIVHQEGYDVLGYPSFPPYATEDDAREAIDVARAQGNPIDGAFEPRWRPELDQNDHVGLAHMFIEEADQAENVTAEIALLLRAQIEATFALRDQIAGYRPDPA
ncbi:hypothetical protein SAMN06295974_3800 [Plantibacter flavus]|uniref:Uncharacterized protein n=1 Tax=Plantibacter flavus TaxID=150123 RepID=A0A3N2BLK4_9MICO|nr:hypothetical protein [Plantibacter flavus]ROR76052.1 hypothetical protein EDD42_4005 [Plantibacter flavus]SMG48980.1 hypothetical protein SAMN06295974_3800 [Plantibacter flavus]